VSSEFGLDFLEIAFVIARPEFDDPSWQIYLRNRGHTEMLRATRFLDGLPAAVRVVVYGPSAAFTFSCCLSFNPARFVDPIGIGLCRAQDVIPITNEILLIERLWLHPIHDIKDMEVRRIDVARNFYEISDPGRYIVGLESFPRRRAQHNFVYRGSSTQSGLFLRPYIA
jgi:hypothetical protein